MINNTICINSTCPHNTGKNCIAAEECADYKPVDCTKCLWENSCDWDPNECHFILDPKGE